MVGCMAHLFVRHTVADFDKWHSAFEEDEPNRDSHGLKLLGLHRGLEDSNDVTAVFDLDSVDRAKEFLGSEDLKKAMMEAGVQGMPEIWFTD